ncbi:MAG: hypothetical protein GC189_03115 [Alphaproteobacteria bacterium]|nr:hypothetical protein [Alphaproteobacteria bacterium]
MTALLAPGARVGARHVIGAILAVLGVIIPALPIGPWAAQPPFPLIALWAAYGWASEPNASWRAPLFLFALGALHDQLAGGPYGVFAALYPFGFFVGFYVNRAVRASTLIASWAGFAIVCAAVSGLAAVAAMAAFGRNASAQGFIETAAITALLFPLVRTIYMSDASALQRAVGGV